MIPQNQFFFSSSQSLEVWIIVIVFPLFYLVLQNKEKVFTNSYKFRAKDGSFITLKSQWFSFMNPWTKELEYIVSNNTVVL